MAQKQDYEYKIWKKKKHTQIDTKATGICMRGKKIIELDHMIVVNDLKVSWP